MSEDVERLIRIKDRTANLEDRDVLSKACRALTGSKWMRIDSAPIGCTEFLAYDPVAQKYDVCYRHARYGVTSTQMNSEYGAMESEFNADRATHWQALPAPPS